jgi:hypothetical protein
MIRPVWFALVLLLTFKGESQTVQNVTLFAKDTNGVSFAVATNQLITIVGYNGNHAKAYGFAPNGIEGFPYMLVNVGGDIFSSPESITGLTNITFKLDSSGEPSWMTLRVTNPNEVNVVSNYVPADAVVIPASATGNVQIILESSSDLVNWTSANPGIYGPSSATNRFFRVRAVVQ